MSKNYNLKEMYTSMVYVPHATGIEYLCYLFHIHDLGRKNKIDNFLFSHLIMSSVLVHAGCYYKMRGSVVYKPRYLSQFWRLEVQDQGASMVN